MQALTHPKRTDLVIPTREEIVDTLRRHKVSTRQWGRKGTTHRSLDDLIGYMQRDQMTFRNDALSNGQGLTIDVNVVVVIVCHQYKKQWLELYEEAQVFQGNAVLNRGKTFNGIAETLKKGEDPLTGARRCLKEELKFHNPLDYVLSAEPRIVTLDPMPSEKWPGLTAVYHRHVYDCVICRRIFLPGGYAEQEKGRTIFFRWKPRKQGELALAA